jgi:hypothetical protein
MVEGKERLCTNNFCSVKYVDALIKRIREHIMRFILCALISKSHLKMQQNSLGCK